MASHFLQTQLRAYADSWQHDHQQAMACWELESRLKLALMLYELIGAADERRSKEMTEGDAMSREAHLREFNALYAEWLRLSEEMLDVITQFESKGFQVEAAEQYRSVCSQLRGVLALPVEQIIQSLKDLNLRRFRPIGEIRNELRRRSGACKRVTTPAPTESL